MLIMNVIFSPLQEHCVYYGNRNSQIVAKINLSQIKASLMKHWYVNRCWLCTSFLTSHKIDCGVVAMVTKIAKMVYR